MATIVVDFDALDRLRGAIERSIADAEEQLAALADRVRLLTRQWQGAAAEGAQRIIADWLAAQADLRGQLEYLHTLVVTARDNHAAALATNVATWRI
ncbi:MAG TPA: WXG100 family type VII secretion target [Pseudonocardiaceae bacterium]|nr:WXG100 family type VII secretion target [Pseudonocardiaceae bacterium]